MKKSDIIFGIHPIMEAINSEKEIDKILVQKDMRNPAVFALVKLANEHKIPLQYVPVEKINRITSKNHQGVLCFMSSVEYQDIENVLPLVFEKGEVPLVILLDRITDVRNFGAIARTVECAGVHAVIIPLKNAAQINADAIKTSSGAIHNINICRVSSLLDTVKLLQNSGLQIIACTEKSQETIYDINLKIPTAIILGSEEDGISNELLSKADYLAKIPILGEIESLNASVAAGVVLYEAVRQRLEK